MQCAAPNCASPNSLYANDASDWRTCQSARLPVPAPVPVASQPAERPARAAAATDQRKPTERQLGEQTGGLACSALGKANVRLEANPTRLASSPSPFSSRRSLLFAGVRSSSLVNGPASQPDQHWRRRRRLARSCARFSPGQGDCDSAAHRAAAAIQFQLAPLGRTKWASNSLQTRFDIIRFGGGRGAGRHLASVRSARLPGAAAAAAASCPRPSDRPFARVSGQSMVQSAGKLASQRLAGQPALPPAGQLLVAP